MTKTTSLNFAGFRYVTIWKLLFQRDHVERDLQLRMHHKQLVGRRLCSDPLGSSQRSHCWIWGGNTPVQRKKHKGRECIKGRRTEKEGKRTKYSLTVLLCIVIVLVSPPVRNSQVLTLVLGIQILQVIVVEP